MLLVITLVIITVAYYLLKLNYSYWKKRGVPGPEPTLFIGNTRSSFFLKKNPGEVFTDIYNEFPNEPLVGIFRMFTPIIIARDPDFIREITVKSFSNFHDNDIDVDIKKDPIVGRNPFVLKGEQWRIVRQQLTPCFTSGKMKTIYPLLVDMSQRLVTFIEKLPEALNGDGIEAKQLCIKFTLNNVASCAFGVEGKCFEEPDSKFQDLARRFFSADSVQMLKVYLIFQFPFLTKIFTPKFVPKDVEDDLRSFVSTTLKHREENNVVRNDFLHFMSELKKTSNYPFTDEDVAAHAAGFLGDGYETSSIVMSFILYHLADNPEAQTKLREEINKNFDADGIPYDVILNMPYLEAVYNESHRITPAGLTMGKRCTSRYTYEPKGTCSIEKALTIEKGTRILLPIYGLHHDPKYFGEPEKFLPERFLPENKDKMTKYTFLPFGEGPRACLGQRFGSLQIKTGIVHIVKNYELTVNKKTRVPFKFDPTYFMLSVVGGLWIDLKKIK